MKIGKIMKLERTVWATIIIGIIIVLICLILAVWVFHKSWWQVFAEAETILGYVANLTIVAAAIRYMTYKTIHINGIGKIRIGREHYNIQDLTNLISRCFFRGKNFLRTPVLDAFYGEDPVTVIKPDPEYEKYSEDSANLIRLNIKGKEWVVKRSSVRSLEALIDAVKWIHFDGNDIDPVTRKEIYTEWYNID